MRVDFSGGRRLGENRASRGRQTSLERASSAATHRRPSAGGSRKLQSGTVEVRWRRGDDHHVFLAKQFTLPINQEVSEPDDPCPVLVDCRTVDKRIGFKVQSISPTLRTQLAVSSGKVP